MQARCPECGNLMTVEDLIEPGHTSLCSKCGAWFDAESFLQDDTYNAIEQDTYVVDWQIGE